MHADPSHVSEVSESCACPIVRWRRWLLALGLGFVCAVVAGAMVWVAVGRKYTATAYLRIAPQPEKIVFQTAAVVDRHDYEIYKNTQRQVITSPFVLRVALAVKEISELDSIKRQVDPVAWLEKAIRVGFPGDSEIMAVSMTGDDPEEAAILVTGVVSAYLSEVVERHESARNQRLAKLEEACADKASALRSKRTLLKKLAEQLGISDAETLSLTQQVALQEYSDYQRELVRIRLLQRRVEAELKAQQERLAELPSLELSDAEVDAYVARGDLSASETIAELARLEKGLTQDPAKPPAELEAARARIEELRSQLRQRIRELGRAQSEEIIRERTVEGKAYRLQEKQLAEEVERKKAEVERIGTSSVDLDMLRAEIDTLSAVLRSIAEEREILTVELHSDARRITLIQTAQPSLSPSNLQARIGLTVLAAGLGLIAPLCCLIFWLIVCRIVCLIDKW